MNRKARTAYGRTVAGRAAIAIGLALMIGCTATPPSNIPDHRIPDSPQTRSNPSDVGFLTKTRRFFFGLSRAELASKAFESEDADMRREGIMEMFDRRWGRSKAAIRGYGLMAAAKHEEPTVRSAALRVLSLMGKDAVPHVGAIFVALGDRSENVRWDAAVALNRVIHESAVEPLRVHVARDRNVDVRIASAKALRHYRRTDVAAALVGAMGDRSWSVSKRAHASLVELVGKDLGADAADWSAVAKKLPPLPARPRPWWDVFGMTTKEPPDRSQ